MDPAAVEARERLCKGIIEYNHKYVFKVIHQFDGTIIIRFVFPPDFKVDDDIKDDLAEIWKGAMKAANAYTGEGNRMYVGDYPIACDYLSDGAINKLAN